MILYNLQIYRIIIIVKLFNFSYCNQIDYAKKLKIEKLHYFGDMEPDINFKCAS